MPEAQESNLWVKISQIVGLVAGLAAFVYIAGAAVLWVRLFRSNFPADPVVTSLPRELVIGIGMKSVVGPALVLAIVAAAGIAVVKRLRATLMGTMPKTHGTAGVVVGVISGTIALLLVPDVAWVVGWAVAGLTAYFIALGFGKTVQNRGLSFATVALIALAIGLLGATIRIFVEVADPRLDNAVVCVNDGGSRYTGLLIGESSGAVYLGIRTEHVVVSIPRSRIGELWIGPKTHDCSVPVTEPRKAPS